MTSENILIGAHTSAAGGVHRALLEGKQIGATTIQFFTSNQKQWKGRQFTSDDLAIWQRTLQETGLQHLMSHDSYLINLGCPNAENLEKSRKAFQEEVIRCVQLGVNYLNFHPGASLGEDVQKCLDCIIESLLLIKPLVEQGKTRLLLEATAGQGSSVGHRFEQLAYIIQGVQDHIPIGVCIDTCHIFVAGYDIRTAEAWDQTLKEFDKVVGLSHLYAFHVNDSMKDLGSRVDRHAELGEGKIGWSSFQFLMTDPRTRHLPKYLETPGGPAFWEKEIQKLKGFV
ncbi:endonuclease IV [Candidatus Protochlamydia naegleriophila]|uniref:Probable endonuclease 4 n=1 Tax=Candidatus Protochlamydia naegleriophila TaxID=389348 RepID=A0A0U5J7G5_9BACT|nr:deoxyribonuclease IV [Candidatus Protochlamydia naegleriophila]CUI16025.1 endonuclease IV [Candidatus Protochlamydia naegleriophila]